MFMTPLPSPRLPLQIASALRTAMGLSFAYKFCITLTGIIQRCKASARSISLMRL